MNAEALPAPFVPPAISLADFAFMPVDVRRVRDSRFAAITTGEEFRAGFLLWAAAWHQVPAGSLPDDDIELAQLAGYGRVVKEWQTVRPGALHGFIRCSDGRFYHPVVCEKAVEAHNRSLDHQCEKECGRIRKANKVRKERGEPELPMPERPVHLSLTLPQAAPQTSGGNGALSGGNAAPSDGNPCENALKGKDRDRDRDNLTNNPQNGSAPLFPETGAAASKAKPSKGNPLGWPEDAFEQFWKQIWDRKDKKDARAALDKIRESGKVEFSAIMAGLASYKLNKPDRQAWKGPAAWLRGEKWNDEWNGANGAHSAAGNGAAPGDTSIEFPGGVRAPESVLRSSWGKGYWAAAWGPRPDESGCVVPPDVLARIINPALAGEAAGRA